MTVYTDDRTATEVRDTLHTVREQHTKVRILIADDHGVLRAGLRSLLSAEADLEVVGEAADGEQALRLARQLDPDVLLADISMPGPSGIEVAQRLRRVQPSTRVLILTMHEDQGLVREAVQAGAVGYIFKRAVESELINAIRAVAGGGSYIPEETRPAHSRTPERSLSNTEPLSETELSVLRLMVLGHTSRQIADNLGLDMQEVEGLRMELTRKLGTRSRIELIQYARAHGLLDA